MLFDAYSNGDGGMSMEKKLTEEQQLFFWQYAVNRIRDGI